MNNYNCYIHIPFCRSKCKYCRFASFSVLDNLKTEKYVDFLCNEIKSVSGSQLLFTSLRQSGKKTQEFKNKNLQTRNGKKYIGKLKTTKGILNTIYFGGGTPSILSEKQLEKIFKSLKNYYIFSENIEITMETTPEEISLEKLKYWQKLGINRISIGLQSLNKKTLETIGRSKKPINIEEKFILLGNFLKNTNYKIKSISVDFIIGLPFVKFGETLKDVKYLLERYYFINHISVYMLEDYYNVGEKNDKFEQIIYPENWKKNSISEQEIGEEYLKIKNFLEKNRFFRYEFSNFAKTSSKLSSLEGEILENISFLTSILRVEEDFKNFCICKHNFGYWTHKEILGFGLGASSFLGKTRFKNSENFLEYYMGKGKIKEKLTREDLFLEKTMFSIRTLGIEKKYIQKLNKKNLLNFLEDGYLKDIGKRIILADKGALYLDYILENII